MHPCDLLKKLVPEIKRAVASVCRRRSVFGEDVEDVEQEVMIKLAEDDCAALARLRDESSARTFAWTVATRVVFDGIRERKGRWRPSAIARSLGTTAVALETLLFRDGWSYDEAAGKLLAERIGESRDDLDAIRAKLPERPVRRFVSEEAVTDLDSPEGVEDRVRDREREIAKKRLEQTFPILIAELDPEDRFILKRLFLSGRSVAQVADELATEQRPLYRRRDRILRSLRDGLEAAGLNWEEICQLMDWHNLVLGWDDGDCRGKE